MQIFHPTYQLGKDSPYFLTVDGRLGVLLEYPDRDSALVAMTTAISKFGYMHIQCQDFFGKYLVSISKSVVSVKTSIKSIFLHPSQTELMREFVDTAKLLDAVFDEIGGQIQIQYPSFQTEPYHLFKLKYPINWPEQSNLFMPLDGFCLVHLPFDSASRILYYSKLELRDLLQRGILCIEFTDSFKLPAFQFWQPFGATKYLARLFKL